MESFSLASLRISLSYSFIIEFSPYSIIKAVENYLKENSVSDHQMLRIESKSTVFTDDITFEKFFTLQDAIRASKQTQNYLTSTLS